MRLVELFEAPAKRPGTLKQVLQLLHTRAGDRLPVVYSWQKLEPMLDKLNVSMSLDHVKELIARDSDLSGIAKINDRGQLELIKGADLDTDTDVSQPSDLGGLDIDNLGADTEFANSGLPGQTGVAPQQQVTNTDLPADTDNPSEVPIMARRALARRV